MEIAVPKLGMTMEEGTLVRWLVAPGAAVASGEPLYLLETDKVETEIESPAAGVIELIGQEGVVYEVGTVVAVLR